MMETVIEKQRCTGCHACFNACPVRAIRMEEDEEGFLYPQIQQTSCINCGRCRDVCPVLSPPSLNVGENVFACAAADLDQRLASSSGGVFSLLAERILSQGGLVCGAAYDTIDRVVHILIRDPKELAKIRGTKYVQSEIGSAFRQIESALNEGRIVLFSGTPCQVAGLKSFLGKDPETLLTVDLICHGVPSPGVWRDYVRILSKGSSVVKMNHRAKDPDTGKTLFSYQLASGEQYEKEQKDDLYIKGFLQNLFLRRSCFNCSFKGTRRCSDLTIGDFWSAKEFHPTLADGMGTSAVIVHSEKGKEALDSVLGQTRSEKSGLREVETWNECLTRSVSPTEKREQFYARWKQEPLNNILEEMTVAASPKKTKTGAGSILKRVIRKIKSLNE